MSSLSFQPILDYRAQSFRTAAGRRIVTKEEAVAFVNERGYVYFWPIKEATLPSLWAAVAGDRPVPDQHDDPGHVTWGWKDEMLGTRQWYYAKVLRKRATFISLDVLPHFYALSENYGEPDKDYLLQYQEGRLTWEAKMIYETILNEGALDTVSLRKLARMTNKSQRLPLQPRAGNPPGGFQDPAGGHRAGGRVEIRLRLRVRPPPLSRPARSSASYPAGRGAAAPNRALFALGGRGPRA